MKPIVCSHTRCGVHYLAKLIHENLDLKLSTYEDLHFSHSRLPEQGVPFIHLHRPILPAMLSIWRAREHLGIHKDVDFSTMITTPWERMPRSAVGPARFNGEYSEKVCSPRPFEGTLPERWVSTLKMFQSKASLSLSYDYAVSFPYETLHGIVRRFDLAWRVDSPKLVLQRVGWWAEVEEQPDVRPLDIVHLEGYQSRCRFSY